MENKKHNFYKNIYGNNDNVLELKYKDFKINKREILLINNNFKNNQSLIIFYAPWCSHCQKMYDDVRELSITNMYKFNIGAVNINDNKNKNYLLSDFLKIKSIPCAYIIKNNKLIRFHKELSFENLFYYININI